MSTYFDELERQLVARCDKGAHHRRRAGFPKWPLSGSVGGLVIASGVAVAIAVAVIAITVSGGSPTRELPTVATGPHAALGLINELGVLRRPQTAADRAANRLAAGPLRAPGLGSVVPGLTRLIARVPNGRLGPVEIYVVVQPPTGKVLPPPPLGVIAQRGYTAAVQITSPDRGGGWATGANAAGLRDVNQGDSGWGYYAVLVPDGIARVRWTFQTDTTLAPRPIGPYTATATVHDNVAFVRVAENGHGQVLVGATAVTWYTSMGRVFGTFERPTHPIAPGGALECEVGQLAIATRHSFAAGGTAGAYITFTNRSRRPCLLRGWPNVHGLTAAGARVPLQRWPAQAFPGPTVQVRGAPVIVLRFGQRADAIFAGSDGPSNLHACGAPLRSLEVTVPGGSRSVRVSARIAYLGGFMRTCSTIRLSPLLPSSDLYHG